MLFGLASNAHAHDFWLAPHTYHLDKPEKTGVTIMVGHPKDRTEWSTDAHRIVSFKSIGRNGIQDQQTSLNGFKDAGNLSLSLKDTGTHILAIETAPAQNILSGADFNAYLDEEGLTPIKQIRAKSKTTNTAGREIYSRRSKALIQVGSLDAISDLIVTKPIGHTLEIVPTKNPYSLALEEEMGMQVYYRGLPTSGIKVLLISLDTIAGDVAMAKTDANGLVSFKRPPSGNWMVHAVWSAPIENDERADFDTTFSSLSFGFK